ETLSRIIDPEDRATTVLFGDGAGAAVVARPTGEPGLLAWAVGCDGSAAGLLEVPAGGSRLQAPDPTVAERGHPPKAAARHDVGERADPVGCPVTERVAFVTGGSRGIGKAVVVALARAGHPVAFCYTSDEDGARATQEAAEHAGGKVLAVRADVADANAVD